MLNSTPTSMQRSAWVLVVLFLGASFSGFALAQATTTAEPTSVPAQWAAPILVEGLPPLMCGEDLCERPTRLIDIEERHTEEPDRWWLGYGPDLDWNGMDDRLQRVLAGSPSDSPTAVTGPDGRLTVAIVVDYAWYPSSQDVEQLRTTLEGHGWIGEEAGAWFSVLDSLNAVVIDKVPVSALMDIYRLDGVVVIENQNVMVPANGVASEAARALPSDVYTASTYERGYYGEGVVIAVLDTGVETNTALSTISTMLTMNRTATPRVTTTKNGWRVTTPPHPLQILTERQTRMTAKDTALTLRPRPWGPAARTASTQGPAWVLILSTSRCLPTPEVPIPNTPSTVFNG